VTVYQSLFDLRLLFTGFYEFLRLGFIYLQSNLFIVFLTLLGAGICFFAPNTREISEKFEPKWYHAAYSGVLLVASLFFMGTVSGFLYFQF
jgi:hypothetical protein